MSDALPLHHTTEHTELSPDDPLRTRIRQAAEEVRGTTPLAQSFTNFVTINLVANAQLASGGTAAMSFLPDDIIDTARIAPASYINVGTLLPFYREALGKIARAFQTKGHRWVLDPVAAGIGSTRTAILTAFQDAPPNIIRANASEVIALRDMWGLGAETAAGSAPGTAADGAAGTSPATRPAGVESVDDVDAAAEAAVQLARYIGRRSAGGQAAVAVSGAIDLITDGTTIYRLPGGSALLTKITGAGCALGGVIATYLTVTDSLAAAIAGSALFNRASEIAQQRAEGPGSFQVSFLDALWNVTPDQIADSSIRRV